MPVLGGEAMSDQPLGENHYRAERAEARVRTLEEALRLKCDEYKMHDPGWCAACDSARAALAGEDREDAADAARTKALWESRTDSTGSDKGFVKIDSVTLAGEVKP